MVPNFWLNLIHNLCGISRFIFCFSDPVVENSFLCDYMGSKGKFEPCFLTTCSGISNSCIAIMFVLQLYILSNSEYYHNGLAILAMQVITGSGRLQCMYVCK